MVNKGNISINRKITDWEWYSDANTFRVFMHLLLNANWKEKTWKGHIIKRGQLITSSMSIAQDLRLSRQSVRLSISKLKSTNEITTTTTNKFTFVTIVKYDVYQHSTKENNPQTNPQPTQPTTNKQPTSNQQTTTTNKDNNYNKENKEIKGENFLNFGDSKNSHLERGRLTIFRTSEQLAKNIIWNNREKIANNEFSEIVMVGGTHIININNTILNLTIFPNYLQKWAIDKITVPHILILFTLFCDINGSEGYMYAESENDGIFDTLFEEFKKHFNHLFQS